MKLYKLSQIGKMGEKIVDNLYFKDLSTAKDKLNEIYKTYKEDENTEEIKWQDEDGLVFHVKYLYSWSYEGGSESDTDYRVIGIETIITED